MTYLPGTAIDPHSGLAIPQQRVALFQPKLAGVGTITYRCHTCGESIVKPWEAFFFDPAPATAWASYVGPARMSRTMTTHHDWHMAAEGD
jgi:hypothetical protein